MGMRCEGERRTAAKRGYKETREPKDVKKQKSRDYVFRQKRPSLFAGHGETEEDVTGEGQDQRRLP